MKKIVVPTDFSETSLNAFNFAILLAKELGDSQIILYNVFDSILAGSDGTPLYNDTEARTAIAMIALQKMRDEISKGSKVPVECIAEEGDLVNNLERLTRNRGVDLVVMGINGASRLEQIMIGSNTLKVAHRSGCPVMIIPPDARYEKIKTVVLTTDMKEVERTTPVAPIQKILDLLKPKLIIAHVDEIKAGEDPKSAQAEKQKLESIFKAYQPQYVFIKKSEFTEGINAFSEKQKADLLITLPKRHSFMSALFKSSHNKRLAYHTHLPILAIHE